MLTYNTVPQTFSKQLQPQIQEIASMLGELQPNKCYGDNCICSQFKKFINPNNTGNVISIFYETKTANAEILWNILNSYLTFFEGWFSSLRHKQLSEQEIKHFFSFLMNFINLICVQKRVVEICKILWAEDVLYSKYDIRKMCYDFYLRINNLFFGLRLLYPDQKLSGKKTRINQRKTRINQRIKRISRLL